MLWLWILIAVIALFAIIGFLSLTLDISSDNDEYTVDVKYAFLKFRVYPDKKRKPKKKKKSKAQKNPVVKSEPAKSSEKKETSSYNVSDADLKLKADNNKKIKKTKKKKIKSEKNQDLKSVFELFELIEGLPVKLLRIINKVRITDFELYMDVGGDDAYEAALNFGKTNAGIWTAVGVAQSLFTVDIKKIKILCDYDIKNIKYKLRTKIKLRLFTLVVSSAGIFIRILLNQRKGKVEENARN